MNSKHLYTIPQRNLLLLGTGLVILGSFLPWEQGGDFLAYWRHGIQFFPVFADHGGMLVLLLGILILGLVFRSQGIVNYPIPGKPRRGHGGGSLRTPCGQSGSLPGLRLVPTKWRCPIPPTSG